jgi:hypothetical protein
MSTAELYRLPSVGTSTAPVGPRVRVLARSLADALITSGTTEEAVAHAQAMRELAALSFDRDSLDRHSAVDIWGFDSAE